jgi:hypothetical protein
MSNDESFREDERLEEIAARLRKLPGEAEPARDLWPGVAARIAARKAPERPGWRRVLLQAAAALAIFAGGVLVGRSTAERRAEAPAPHDPFQTAAEVQRTGSEYVAALATLEKLDDRRARRQGREAAISTLYGAAHELARIAPEDPGASRILEAVSQTRSVPAGKAPKTRIVKF